MACVSVIIPAYNRAGLIGQTLDSVCRQTFTDWECIVVDDGSADDTPGVVQRYAEQDRRVRLIRQSNGNAASARNRGAAEAKGEFLAFLDSDDLFEPDKLAWQVALMRERPEAVLVYGETFLFQDGDPGEGELFFRHVLDKPQGPPPIGFERLLTMNPIIAPLVRASAFRAAGGFDTSLPSAEDWDMWLSLARCGAILFEPRLAQRYRSHGGPSGNKSAQTLRNYECARRLFAKHVRHVPLHRRNGLRRAVRRYWRRGYAPRLLRDADRATSAGDWPEARRLWRALVGLDPRVLARHRHVRINFAWALLPTTHPPIWRRSQPAHAEPQA